MSWWRGIIGISLQERPFQPTARGALSWQPLAGELFLNNCRTMMDDGASLDISLQCGTPLRQLPWAPGQPGQNFVKATLQPVFFLLNHPFSHSLFTNIRPAVWSADFACQLLLSSFCLSGLLCTIFACTSYSNRNIFSTESMAWCILPENTSAWWGSWVSVIEGSNCDFLILERTNADIFHVCQTQ